MEILSQGVFGVSTVIAHSTPSSDTSKPADPGGLGSRILSLDGLRAVSILAVMYDHGHLIPNFVLPYDFLKKAIPFFNGTAGVCLFFVISGFLITTLLLRERQKTGRISLRDFYIRRTLRIFPPFYIYLAFVAVLWAWGTVEVNPRGFLAAATYWRNFYYGPEDWIIQHSWSLTIEEQFYILWPTCVALLTPPLSFLAGLGLMLFWPLLRFLKHGFLFSPIGTDAMRTAGIDTILFGVILAYLVHSPRWGPRLRNAVRGYTWLVVPLVTLWMAYTCQHHWPASWTFALPLLRNVSLTILLWWSIVNVDTPIGRLLNWKPVVFVGLISYSLYLWQQLFLVPYFKSPPFPQLTALPAYILAFVAGTLSYYLVEKPTDRLRKRFSHS